MSAIIESGSSSWDKWSEHVLAELTRLSDGITKLVDVIDEVRTEITRHETWRRDHIVEHEKISNDINDNYIEIVKLRKMKYILIGMGITISTLIGSGLLTYIISKGIL